nr:1-acyl-sn-glycerol-3-phosphate acyltransferase [Flaviflexus huanghaiensis]
MTAPTPWKADIQQWPAKSIVLGAPHTSNMDAVFMVIIMWLEGRSFNFLVKDEVMKYPVLRSIVRWLGGIPVNRRRSTGITSGIAQSASELETFTLCITPKGTRSKQEFWKSGFYRMAYENNLPLTFGFVDSVTKTFGTGPTYYPTWDIEADMEAIRGFYGNKRGFRPEHTSLPRLRAETDQDAAAYLLRPIDDNPMT